MNSAQEQNPYLTKGLPEQTNSNEHQEDIGFGPNDSLILQSFKFTDLEQDVTFFFLQLDSNK